MHRTWIQLARANRPQQMADITIRDMVEHQVDPRRVEMSTAAIDMERELRAVHRPAERRMLYQFAMGYTQAQIAAIHHVSRRTVDRVFQAMMEEL